MSGRRPPEPTDEELIALRYRAKAELRKKIRAVRAALPKEARVTRSNAIAALVTALPEFERAKVVAAYLAMQGEVDPAPIVSIARARGKRIALPRVDREGGRLVLHAYDDATALAESGMGYLEPRPDAVVTANEEIDLVIVPALAVDERGYRIGWGKGYYDRLLPKLENAVSVAVIYDFQLLAEVPETPGDVPVDLIAHDGGMITPARDSIR